MDPITGYKTKEKNVPEFTVRWKGYVAKFYLWVPKSDTSSDCINEFNSMSIDTASKTLATIPVTLFQSSPGHAMAKDMTTMVKHEFMLKDGCSMPKLANKKQRLVEPQKNSNISTTENYTHDYTMSDKYIRMEEHELHASKPVLMSDKKYAAKRKFDRLAVNGINLFLKYPSNAIKLAKKNPATKQKQQFKIK